MLTDEQIAQAGYAHSVDDDEPLFTFGRKELIAMVRELLSASKPAAPQIDDQQLSVGYRRGIKDAFHSVNMMNANRQGRTDKETCSYIVRSLAEWLNALSQDDATAAPAAPAQSGEAVAWAHEDDPRECISDLKKRDMLLHNGVPGRKAAEKYSIPSFAAAQPTQPAKAGGVIGWRERWPQSGLFPDSWSARFSTDAEYCNAMLEEMQARGATVELMYSGPAQSAPVLDDERAAFEAWCKAEGISTTLDDYQELYLGMSARVAWRGWQARAASPQAAAAK